MPPGGDEIARGVLFLVIAIFYAATWLAMAMLFSVLFRSAATSALCALGVWMLFSVLWPIIVPFVAQAFSTPDPMSIVYGLPDIHLLRIEQAIAAFSPNTLFSTPPSPSCIRRRARSASCSAASSRARCWGRRCRWASALVLVWPQITGLIAATIVVFTLTYVAFQRQEITGVAE